jgi:outer membrane biosynthesis protein TonB
MKNYTLHSKREDKHSKKGLMITAFVHLSVLGLAFFPLMSAAPDVDRQEQPIELASLEHVLLQEEAFVVNADDKSRINESAEEAQSTVQNTSVSPSPVTEPIPQPKPLELEEEETTTEVQTSEDEKADEISSSETPDLSPSEAPSPSAAIPSGNTAQENTRGGTASNNTAATGDGGNDNDLQEGVFGRKVMKRPNIKGLTKEKGKVAIKICVSQQGTVIASKYLPKFSTITDPALIAAATKAVRYYKFDVDYSAPKKQWGKLTFVFDL